MCLCCTSAFKFIVIGNPRVVYQFCAIRSCSLVDCSETMAERLSREKVISATYAEIHKWNQNGQYERALKAANRSELQVLARKLNYINLHFSSPYGTA